jgi:alpha-tubulin suppressor-like RCC1 family protein
MGFNDTNIDIDIPFINPNFIDIIDIKGGYGSIIALDINGIVFGLGDNTYSQLGFTYEYPQYYTSDVINITDICNLPKIKIIASGPFHILLYSTDGT